MGVMTTLADFTATTISGRDQQLADHLGSVVLVVNTASKCGLTPQYSKLEELQRTYSGRGFTVLGFPSNQFMQELGSEEKIATFCSVTYGVTFPMFEKVRLNGKNAHPLYQELTKTPDPDGKAGKVKWNFEKFLVLPYGSVRRFRPKQKPDSPEIVEAIEAHLPS